MTAEPIRLLEEFVAALDAIEADKTDAADDCLGEVYDRIDDLALDGPAEAYTKLYAFFVQAEIAVSEAAGLDFAGAKEAPRMLRPRREGASGEELAPLAA